MAEALLALLGLGLAAPGVIDVFLRAGEYVTGRLQENRKAKELAINLRTFYISDEVDLLRLYMKSAQAIVLDPRTEETEKTRLNNKFHEIKSLLQSIHEFTNIVLAPDRDPFHSKRRSAISEIRARTTQCKACIENFRNRVQALKDLRSTESVLLLRPQDFNWLLSDGTPILLNESTRIGLGRSTREIRGVKPEPRRFFYENRSYTQSTKTLIQANLEVVLQKLSIGGPGVLPLLGFIDDIDAQKFQVIFVLPPLSGDPTTLLSLLQDSEHVPSLNVRVSICVQLAKAALYLHTQGLVHKSIRLDNIAILPSQNGDLEDHQDETFVFLFGFDVTRPTVRFNTEHAGETLWQRRIYQHPQRQRRVADTDYNMGHDIYSLGACASEILQWKSFVSRQRNQYGEEGYGLSPEYLRFDRRLKVLDGDTNDLDAEEMAVVMSDPQRVQRVLLACSEGELPQLVGKKLSNVVSDCLKMLDKEGEKGDDGLFKATDRTKIGTEFVDCVLAQLCEVSNAI